jgi:glutaredoxin
MTRLRRNPWLIPLLIAAGVYFGLQAWRDRQDAGAGALVATLAKPGDIVMMSSVTCIYCKLASRFFAVHGIPFNECFIETDNACAEAYRQQGSPGTPTLLVRGDRQVGFDVTRVAQALGAR